MSKKRNVVDDAIVYVMHANLEAAAAFVATLASVVKARGLADMQKQQAAPAAPKKPTSSKPKPAPAATKGTTRVVSERTPDPDETPQLLTQ